MIKTCLRESFLTKELYQKLKQIRDEKRYRLATQVEHTFIDRSKHRKDLCIIIAGYKPYLYQDVFERLVRFMPEDMDVCIASSGVFSAELERIASKQGWSYLSTKRNCVTLLQNVAILKHPEAEYIYKIDEDIFVTEHCFEQMKETFLKVERDGLYDVGFVAPLLPINGYCHLRILDKLNLKQEYATKFERPIYASYSTRMIEKSPEVAKFFWGEGGYIPSIDELARCFGKESFSYSACPVRFSIGFILMRREFWESMGMWKVFAESPCMGVDEEQICSECIIRSKAMIVAENAVAGHLSFGQQNVAMKQYYEEHRDRFRCPEKV
ncbi:hypothetical protein [Clostridium sp. AF32-12BH]|uniref:hypothetical protein n=1 Tax=Clostridium sp. AF32-12BH TaxID=2292006 RepID=UPI000E522512|nr:hypothetical protein [Clostridium sp. AF32-12BH]RHP47295.1 hypothetical protein DWZ40_07665 [Clostridium sp. AF32-12BH]